MIRNLIYCVLISLVLFTPFMYSDELYNGTISAKQIWFYGSMGLLILGFALENLFTRKRLPSRLNSVDISLLVFYSYFFIRACYTPYTPILYNQKFLNYSLLILFYFIVKHACCRITVSRNNLFSGENYPVIVTIMLVLMLTGLVEAIWGLLQLYGVTRSFHSGFKITGTFFNPAPYALHLAAIFPISLTVLMKNERIKELRNEGTIKNEGNKELKNERIKELMNERSKGIWIGWVDQLIDLLFKRYRALKNRYTENPNSFVLSSLHSFIRFVAWLTVISILLVLPATMNRASWVGVGVSSLFIFNQRYHLIEHLRKWLKTGTRKIIVLIGLLILIATIITGLYQFKKGSSIGRLFIWEVTAGKIAEKPLFGYGVGRFEAEYNNWQSDYFKTHPEEMDGPKGMAAGNTKYCFNEFIEMTSETGIIGLFLFTVITASVFMSAKIEISRYFPFLAYSSIFAIISLLIFAMISFPFFSLPTNIVFFLFLVMTSINSKQIFFH